VFFVVCDGLKGLPEVVANVWPAAIVQTCIVHLIRNTFRLTSRKYWDQLKRDMKPIYTAVNEPAARSAFEAMAAKWGERYPAVVRLWESSWAGSPGTLPCRGPLRTGRASRPRIRLKQAQSCRGAAGSVVHVRCAVCPCGRSEHARGVRRWGRSGLQRADRW
jgi:hypothetical protein